MKVHLFSLFNVQLIELAVHLIVSKYSCFYTFVVDIFLLMPHTFLNYSSKHLFLMFYLTGSQFFPVVF